MPPIAPAAVFDQPILLSSSAASRRLYHWGLAALIATCIWFINENGWEIDTYTIFGIVILALASHPALAWANHNRTWFPAFEIAMLTCIPFYAIPLLSHHPELRYYPKGVIVQSSIFVILYIIASYISFYLQKRRVKANRLFSDSLLSAKSYHLIPWGIFLTNIQYSIDRFTYIIPPELSRIITSLFFGIGTLSIFVTSRLWAVQLLNARQKVFFIANVVLQITLQFASLYLISGILIFTLAFVSYSMTKRSIPWVALLVFLPIISILHLGKAQMRGIYWKENATKERATIEQIPAFFSEWIAYGLQAERIERETYSHQHTIFERASLMHMVCLSVDRVPRERDYLKGESYLDIPAAFIPRILWKNKPNTLISTHRLGTHLGITREEDISQVSIAFGMLAEAYINFGVWGVIGLGALFGFSLKRIVLLAQNTSQFSALGILSILLTAWSFQVESTASIWISSLCQAAAFCIGLPMVYRLLTSAHKA